MQPRRRLLRGLPEKSRAILNRRGLAVCEAVEAQWGYVYTRANFQFLELVNYL